MQKANNMQQIDFATVALYFRHGMEAGVLSEANTRDWVLQAVEILKAPPEELVEVLSSRSYTHLFEALKDVPGRGQLHLAGQWLFHDLHLQLVTRKVDAFPTISTQAVQVARITEQGENVQSKLVALDASADMACMGYASSLEECRNELINALAQYAQSPQLVIQGSGMSA